MTEIKDEKFKNFDKIESWKKFNKAENFEDFKYVI